MPKREPTPPPEEESKYFVINYPFPLHANMQIECERYDLAHWVASCIGQEYLVAVYYKPSAPDMVIIEVLKSCPRINALLGAHKWREVLKDPEPDQVNQESRVYYCRYATNREVQKHGWRRIDVFDEWFEEYDPINGPFVTNPYPRASFCEVPPETQVDYGLCRPLPADVFPRPKPTTKQPIVPGSDKYAKDKKSGGPPQLVAAPVPIKQSVTSWATITSSNRSTRSISRASSNDSPISGNGSISSLNTPLPGPPPGLCAPPGLSAKSSQGSSDWGFYASLTPSESSEWPRADATTVEIITSGFASTAISSYEQQQSDKEFNGDEKQEEDDYWVEPPPRPVDWDKAICPEHRVACKAGICKTMAEIEKQKKKEMQKAEKKGYGNSNGSSAKENEDGWQQAKARGRGQGRASGQMRGRARGKPGKWC